MPIRGTHWDDIGEEVVRYDNHCRADGCGKEFVSGENGAGRGYCTNHYALWRRHGEPTTINDSRRAAFREAAIAYADNQTWESRVALCLAAFNCKNRNVTEAPGPDFLLMVTTRPGQRVVDACMAWADFDAEAPMAEYVIVSDAMYAQAECFRRRYATLQWEARQPAAAPLREAA